MNDEFALSFSRWQRNLIRTNQSSVFVVETAGAGRGSGPLLSGSGSPTGLLLLLLFLQGFSGRLWKMSNTAPVLSGEVRHRNRCDLHLDSYQVGNASHPPRDHSVSLSLCLSLSLNLLKSPILNYC